MIRERIRRMSFAVKHILLILLFSAAMGPNVIIRNSYSESRMDFGALFGLIMAIYSITRILRTRKLLKKWKGATVRLPRDYWTPLDGTWIAIVSTMICIREIGDPITDMNGKISPAWEFTWGHSPSSPFSIGALIFTIFTTKIYHIVSNSVVLESSRFSEQHS